MSSPRKRFITMLACLAILIGSVSADSQQRAYPDKIRGYKLSRTNVELKKPEQKAKQSAVDESTLDLDAQALIKFGPPQLARVTPLGISFEIPIVVNPVRQKGHVDFLMFEEMV